MMKIRNICERVSHLYSNIVTNSIDPVVLFKIIIIQYTFGIRFMHQTIKEIQVNNAYRWYSGYNFDERIPHFSTFGKNYKRRFEGTDIFQEIFNQIIDEIIKCKFLNTENIFIDGTHIKACASTNKFGNQVVDSSSKFYIEKLKKEIEADRKFHKKTLNFEHSSETREIKISKTDPECGLFYKGEHKKVFAYSSNTACDGNNFVLAFELASGNVHDSTTFPKLYSSLKEKYKDFHRGIVDSGYKTLAIAKIIIDDGKIPVMSYKRSMTKDGFLKNMSMSMMNIMIVTYALMR